MRATAARIGRIAAASVWGLADQGVVSIASFATIIFVARAASPSSFGLFTVVYTAILVATALQGALFTQPHNVIGATRPRAAYAAYTTSTLLAQLGFALVLAVASLAAAAVARLADADVAELLVVLAPTIVATQLLEFARRVLYTEGRLASAFSADAVGYGGQTLLIVLLWERGGLGANSALWALAAGAGTGAVVGGALIRRSLTRAFEPASVRANWRFGRWLAGGTVGFILSSHLYIYLAAGILGAHAAGVLKAAQTLLGPLNVVLLFLQNVLPTRFARAYARGGSAVLARQLAAGYALSLPIVLGYCVAVTFLATPLLRLVYGQRYDQYGLVVALFAAYYFGSYVAQLVGSALGARQATRPLFVGQMTGAAIAVALGWLLIRVAGVEGAVAGMIVSALCVNLVVWSAFLLPDESRFRSVLAGEGAPATEAGDVDADPRAAGRRLDVQEGDSAPDDGPARRSGAVDF